MKTLGTLLLGVAVLLLVGRQARVEYRRIVQMDDKDHGLFI